MSWLFVVLSLPGARSRLSSQHLSVSARARVPSSGGCISVHVRSCVRACHSPSIQSNPIFYPISHEINNVKPTPENSPRRDESDLVHPSLSTQDSNTIKIKGSHVLSESFNVIQRLMLYGSAGFNAYRFAPRRPRPAFESRSAPLPFPLLE